MVQQYTAVKVLQNSNGAKKKIQMIVELVPHSGIIIFLQTYDKKKLRVVKGVLRYCRRTMTERRKSR